MLGAVSKSHIVLPIVMWPFLLMSLSCANGNGRSTEEFVEWDVFPGTDIRYTTPYYSLKIVLEDGYVGSLVAVDAPNIEKEGKLFVLRQRGSEILVPKGLVIRDSKGVRILNGSLVIRIENRSGVALYDHFDENIRIYEESRAGIRNYDVVFDFRRAEIKKG